MRAGEQLGDIGEAVSLVSTAQAGSLHRVSGGEGYALVHHNASSKPSNNTTGTNGIVPGTNGIVPSSHFLNLLSRITAQDPLVAEDQGAEDQQVP